MINDLPVQAFQTGYALDHICNSFSFMGAGIDDRPHDGWSHSCPTGHRHRRGAGPIYSRATTIEDISFLAGWRNAKSGEGALNPAAIHSGYTGWIWEKDYE